MTAGLAIPLSVSGGSQVRGEVKGITQEVHQLGVEEGRTAAASEKRGNAMRHANQHSRRGGGEHGGWMGGLHALGRVRMGETSHAAHRLGAVMGMGAAGGVALLAAEVGNMILKGVESLHERMVQALEKASEIDIKLYQASKEHGIKGAAYADANGAALARLGTMGATFAEVKAAQEQGLSPEAQAALRGLPNGAFTQKVALASRAFGRDPNQVAHELASKGGARGTDAFTSAAYYAGQEQNYRYTPEQIARARAGGGEIGEKVGQISGFRNRTSAVGIDAIASGQAGGAAAMDMTKALRPDMAIMSEAYLEATEKSEVLGKIAENTSLLCKILQNVTNPFSSDEQKFRQSHVDFNNTVQSIQMGQ